MKNNFCEEQHMSNPILDYHEEVMKTMEMPSWMNVKCPFCNNNLPLRSIRSVAMKFNTRNLGDITLEVFCEKCNVMDTLYFRKETTNILDFIALLRGVKEPNSEPIIEENMYKQNYNNLLERKMGVK